jgi:predicted transcriptional regulator
MATIVDVLDDLDTGSRKRVLAWIEARFADQSTVIRPASKAAAPELVRSRSVGRPHSPNTLSIIESLREQSPATPQVIAQRTGLDRKNVKSCLHRLFKAGVVSKEVRGFYSLASSECAPANRVG